MACCAFAIYVLAQVLAPFVWLKERLFGVAAPRPNPTVAWTLGAPVTPQAGARPGSRRGRIATWLFGAAVLEMLLMAGAGAYVLPGLSREGDDAWVAAQAAMSPRCAELVAMFTQAR